jgi:hypothetical protein
MNYLKNIQVTRNLNHLKIKDDACKPLYPLNDHSIEKGNIQIFFKDLVEPLKREIERADLVLGCVAWLNHPDLLSSLANRECSLVLQKEDLWRPNGTQDSKDHQKRKLRSQYQKLKCELDRWNLPGVGSLGLNYAGSPEVPPLQCVGNYNADQNPSFPRNHHKFLVFCKKIQSFRWKYQPFEYHPYAVWSGSFNFTLSATESFENALLIHDEEIAEAYVKEYAQIFALSEPLDWESEWCSPEYRIGS